MRKFLKLFVILIISLLVVACGNDDTSPKNNGSENIDSTSEIDQTENDDVDEDADLEDVNSESSNLETNDEVPVIAIGETGVIKDTLGTYEVTPTSFKFTEELSDAEEVARSKNGQLIIIDITIKNIGEESLELEDITKASLYDGDSGVTGFDDYPDMERFEGIIEPGESYSAQKVYDLFISDYYELAFGANMPEHISNEVRWALHAEDAE